MVIPQKQSGGKGQALFPYPGMDQTGVCVLDNVCAAGVYLMEGAKRWCYVALVQNSKLFMKFSSSVHTVLFFRAHLFSFFPVSDCQWKCGSKGGMFLQKKRHIKYTYCVGRQTCK